MFEEFEALFEEVAGRVELKILIEKQASKIHITWDDLLNKEQIISLTEDVLANFAQIWCSGKELARMKKLLLVEFAKVEEMVQCVA